MALTFPQQIKQATENMRKQYQAITKKAKTVFSVSGSELLSLREDMHGMIAGECVLVVGAFNADTFRALFDDMAGGETARQCDPLISDFDPATDEQVKNYLDKYEN